MGPLLAFAAFGAAFGLADREIRVFERAAAAEIGSRLSGDGKVVDVRVQPDGLGLLWGALDKATISARHFSVEGLPLYTEPERSKAGRCGNLTLDLGDFRLKGLRVESLHAEIPACRYDLNLALRHKTFRLSRSGVGSGTVRLRQEDLGAFILQKFHEIKEVTVKVYNGIVWVEGYGEFIVVNTRFTVIAELKPVDGRKLELANAKVWFDWRKADDAAAQALLGSLNPVVDLDQDLGLLDAITVEKVTLEGGVLVATGKTRIPVKPKGLTTATAGTSEASRMLRARPSTGSSCPPPWNEART